MSDYYQQYLSSAGGTGESQNLTPQEVQPPMQLGESGPTMPNPYQNLGYFSGFPDPIIFQAPKAQSSRSRKKSIPGMDHVKHRRTRSGCYTCRSRRVKVSEKSLSITMRMLKRLAVRRDTPGLRKYETSCSRTKVLLTASFRVPQRQKRVCISRAAFVKGDAKRSPFERNVFRPWHKPGFFR
jgi:hypothetical protein